MWRLRSTIFKPAACFVGGAAATKLSLCDDSDDFPSMGENISALDVQLRPPGQVENWDSEVRRLVQLQTYKGFKFEIAKPMTPNFVVKHSVQLGESNHNPNAQEHYSFMTQVFNDKMALISTLDQNGRVSAPCLLLSSLFSLLKLFSQYCCFNESHTLILIVCVRV